MENEIIDQFRAFVVEAQVLDRLRYKHSNAHRGARYFVELRTLSKDSNGIATFLAEHIDRLLAIKSYISPEEYQVTRKQISALFSQLENTCNNTTKIYSSLIHHTFFVTFSYAVFASASRIKALCAMLKKNILLHMDKHQSITNNSSSSGKRRKVTMIEEEDFGEPI